MPIGASELALIAPLAVAVMGALAFRAGARSDAARASATAVCVFAGFFSGAICIIGAEILLPARNWQWLGPCSAGAALVGPIACRQSRRERWVLTAIAAFVAACALTPTWASLQPPRRVWIPAFTTYAAVLAGLLEPLPDRVGRRVVEMALIASTGVLAGLLAGLWDLTLGRIAALAMAGWIGTALVIGPSWGSLPLRGALLLFALLVGGTAFCGCIYPQSPAWSLMLVPAGPLALWLTRIGPWARWTGGRAALASVVVVTVVLAVAGVWAVISSGVLSTPDDWR